MLKRITLNVMKTYKDFETRLSFLHNDFDDQVICGEHELTRAIVNEKDTELMNAITLYDSRMDELDRRLIRRS